MNDPLNPENEIKISDEELDDIYQQLLQDDEHQSLDKEVARARAALQMIERVREAGHKETPRLTETLNEKPLPAELQQSWHDSTLPEKIGRFAIKRLVGQGGFGMVFLAHDPNLARDVALKIPRPEAVTTPDLKARFLREGRAAASLAHPNIVPVYESGQAGAICYLAGQYIDGETLDDWAKENRKDLSLRNTASICRSIAEALAHAHQRGVIHRDIKPSNIMISKAEQDGSLSERIQITDFGLAKNIREDSSQTHSGALIGTPSFMSTEQARQLPASPSSDIYSVGAVMYWLLTGEPPFCKQNIVETIQSIINEEPARPRKLNSNVPLDLEAICLKCLEKNPVQRYSNAYELATDLENWLEGKPVTAHRPSWPERSRRWLNANRAIAVSAASIFTILLTTSIISAGFWFQSSKNWKSSERNRIDAVKQTAVAQKQTRRVREAVERLFQVVADEPRLKFAEMEEFRTKLYHSANSFLQELVNDQPEDEELVNDYVTTLLRGARLFRELGYEQEALQLLEKAESAMAEAESETALQFAVKSVRAEVYEEMGDAESALQLKKEVIEFCEKLYLESEETHPEVFAKELGQAARIAGNVGDYKQCEEFNDRQTELLNEIYQAQPLQWPAEMLAGSCLALRSFIATTRRDFERAEQLGDKALAIFNEIDAEDGDSQIQMARMLQKLGINYSYNNKMDKAFSHLNDAEQLLRNPAVFNTRLGLSALTGLAYDRALCAYKTGDFEQSLDDLNSAVENSRLLEQRFPEAHDPLTEIKAMHLTYGVFHTQKRYDEAANQLNKAIDACTTALQQNSGYRMMAIELAGMYANLASLHFSQEQWEEADAVVDRSLEFCRKLHEEDPNNVTLMHYTGSLVTKAGISEKLGDADAELDFLLKYLEIAKHDDRYNGMQQNLIRVYAKTGQFENSNSQMHRLLDETTEAADRYELSRKTAEAANYLLEVEDKHYFDDAATTAIEILNELKEAGYSKGDRSLIELVEDDDFDAIRDLDGFPVQD